MPLLVLTCRAGQSHGGRASETQVSDAKSVERCKDDEQDRSENNCEDVWKHDVSPQPTAPQSFVDLLRIAPPRFIGAPVGVILLRLLGVLVIARLRRLGTPEQALPP